MTKTLCHSPPLATLTKATNQLGSSGYGPVDARKETASKTTKNTCWLNIHRGLNNKWHICPAVKSIPFRTKQGQL